MGLTGANGAELVIHQRPALVLLDREGVLLAHKEPYILAREDVTPIPRSFWACRTLLAMGIPLAIVTNQSPVGRGLVTADFVRTTNEWIVSQIAGPHTAVRVYVCPHVPGEGCDCRKPRPGMLEQAIEHHGVEPRDCWMVGDHDVDMQAAKAAGIRHRFHVLSGRQRTPSRFASHHAVSLGTLIESLRARMIVADSSSNDAVCHSDASYRTPPAREEATNRGEQVANHLVRRSPHEI